MRNIFYEFLFAAPDNATTFTKQLDYVNNLTDVGAGGVLGLVIMLVFGGALFGIMKSFSFDKALSVAMFVTSILGIFLRILGLITDNILYISIILLVISLFMLWKGNEGGGI